MQRVLILGKSIQSNDYDSTEQDIEELLHAMREEHNSSYTSSIVRNMISITDEQTHTIPHGEYLTEEGTLNWTMFTKTVMTGAERPNDMEADLLLFKCASKHLKSVIMQHIHPVTKKFFCTSTLDEIIAKFGSKMSFLPKLVIEVPEYSRDNALFMDLVQLYRQGHYQLCFQMGITFLERSLGDLLVSGMDSFTTRQLKINDMLVHDRLQDILGFDIIFLLRLISGPLQGMNLRNITWHGFLKDDEFPECYASFLLILILSLSDLEQVKLAYKEGNRRPLKTLLDYDTPIEFSFDLEQACSLIDNNFFVPPNQREQWKLSMSMYAQGNVYYTAATMYPLLEHALRRLFAFINSCEDRVLSAETNKLYTTFDDILCPIVEPSMERNKLYVELGVPILLSLFDLLVWKDGPRLRDKLSHGVVDPRGIPKSIVDRTVMISLALFQKYSFRENMVVIIDKRYSPAFHPQMGLYKEIQETSVHVQQFWEKYARNYVEHAELNGDEETKGILMNNPLRAQVHKLLDLLNVKMELLPSRRTSLFDFHEIQKEERFPHIDHVIVPCVIPLQYTGKIGNNIAQELLKAGVLRRVAANVRVVIKVVSEVFDEFEELVRTRKAFKKHRMAFEKYKRNMYALYLMLVMTMRHVELLTLQMDPCEPGIELRDLLLKLVHSLPVCNRNNAWSQATKIFANVVKMTEEMTK
jgi:hypothetical protein